MAAITKRVKNVASASSVETVTVRSDYTMATADWYCHECETYGGNNGSNSMQDHIDYAHDGGIVRIEEV